MNRLVDWTEDFRISKALWEMVDPSEPHIRMSQHGDHGTAYFNSDIVTAYPGKVDFIVRDALVPELSDRELEPDWVFSYAPHGLFVANSCARAIGVKNGYVIPTQGYQTSFNVREGEGVLVVSDDIYSGGGLRKTIDTLQSMGAVVLPSVFTLANLSGEGTLDGRDIIAGAHVPNQRFRRTSCDLCAHGSEALAPRPNWERLQAHEIS